MLEEEGVLRCCLYVLLPSAAKKRGPNAVSVGLGGRPDLPGWVVGQAGAETGLDIGLVVFRKASCPCPLSLPPFGFEGNSAGAGLRGTWEPRLQQVPEQGTA